MSKRMVDYKVENGKIVSIDGYELAGGGDYEIKELVVTENGVYDVTGEAYKPVRVNVPQTAQSGTLKAVLDATQAAIQLFYNYKGTSADELINFNDTANVKTMQGMFDGCSNLTSIPSLDTSKVTNLGSMFNSCSNLTSIPSLDTSNATYMSSMFRNCSKLATIPRLDTSKATNMTYMFDGCSNLTSIPSLDASNVTSFSSIFGYCAKLATIGLYGFTRSISIKDTALGHDALVAFLNQAGIAYNSSQKITIGSTKLALLSDEEKAIATNKGWTLA